MVEVAFMEELGLKWKRWLSNKRRKDGFVEKVWLFAEITVLAVVLDSWSSGLNQPPKDDMVMNKDFSDRRKKWLDDEVESLLTVDSEVEGLAMTWWWKSSSTRGGWKEEHTGGSGGELGLNLKLLSM